MFSVELSASGPSHQIAYRPTRCSPQHTHRDLGLLAAWLLGTVWPRISSELLTPLTRAGAPLSHAPPPPL